MKIIDIIKQSKPSLSFEVFPPKALDGFEGVSQAINEIAKLSPSFMSVTYGAGGGTSQYTAKIAEQLSSLGVTSLAHLTCISSTKDEVNNQIRTLKNLGIENILALRGDITHDKYINNLDFKYAFELIDEIKKNGDFCIGGACYPECHPESINIETDIIHLKNKVDHGCEFLTTQMFFDNDIYYRFNELAQNNGIDVPIVAGIMPITSLSQINKMVAISGNELPKKFLDLLSKYEHDPVSLKQAGIYYSIDQARDIYEKGYNAVHIYSMNKPEVAKQIQTALMDVIK